MTDKQETSRHWILDAIECIKNCEAIVSHCNEIMDSIADATFKSDQDSQLREKYNALYDTKKIAIRVRRRVMKKMFNEFENWQHDRWCILKHSVAAKQFIDEVCDAWWEFWDESLELYKLMSLSLSQFIWEKQQMCARCMLDDLLYDNKDDDG